VRLANRERYFVAGLAILIAAWLLFTRGIKPAFERIDTLNRVIPDGQKTVQALQEKSKQYLTLLAALNDYKAKAALQEKQFEPLAFLESMTKEAGWAKKVAAMKQDVLPLDANYHQIIVEIKMENLTLNELVEFLVKIKSSKRFLQVKSLYTKKNTANPDFLDAVIQISTLKLNDSAQP